MSTAPPDLRADPYYASALAQLGSRAAIEDAGWFDAGPEHIPAADTAWMSVPYEKIRQQLKTRPIDDERPTIVLLTTGAFSPVHLGHIQMMESARAELESRGYFVAGGYLSPSHDAYVSKKLGEHALDAVTRIDLCQSITAPTPWLMCLNWEALGTDRAVNFTDVILWLESYLARHFADLKIKIAYVFGSDNVRFTRTFVARGLCVCTVRPGHTATVARYAADPHVQNNPHIIFASQPSVAASSSQIRQGHLDLMEPRSRARYTRTHAPPPRATYVLRDECGWELAPWTTGRDPDQIHHARQQFHTALTDLLTKVHANAGTELTFHWLRLTSQREQVATLTDKQILSLDAPIPGTIDLAVSRRFALADAHIAPTLSHRPGSPPLPDQLSKIPAGRYTLLDDDACTGATLQKLRALLAPTIQIEAEHLLFRRPEPSEIPLIDILDSRDFLAGAREGGLVVALPDGALARVPYCHPYASASERASVPLAEELHFSAALWRLNEDFFASITPPIRLGEADPAFHRLMHHLGFPPETPMHDISRWHAERCDQTLARAHDHRRSV